MKSTPKNAPELEENSNSNQENISKGDNHNHVFIDRLSARFKGRTFLMIEMAKIFLDQAPVMKKILEDSSKIENHEEIRFEAHKFKSTVNIIGLDALRGLASKTEEIYHGGKPDFDTTELLNEFANQIAVDVRKVQNVIEKITTTEAAS